MSYKNFSDFLVQKIQTIDGISEVGVSLDVKNYQFPSAIVMMGNGSSSLVDSARDRRSYVFEISVYYPISEENIENEEKKMMEMMDKILDKVDTIPVSEIQNVGGLNMRAINHSCSFEELQGSTSYRVVRVVVAIEKTINRK